MTDVLQAIGRLPAVRELPVLLRERGRISVVGTAGSGAPLVTARLTGMVRTRLLVVCSGMEEAEDFAEDMNLLRDGVACCFPALEVLPGDLEEPNEAIQRARLAVLRHLAFGDTPDTADELAEAVYLEPGPNTRAVATSVRALMQPTRSAAELRTGSRTVSVGQEATPAELVTWLVDNGYVSVPQVRAPGHYCLRGGILDAYSHGALQPVRVEFFGDEVDSIRTFDPGTQLSTGRVQRCQFTISEHPAGPAPGTGGSLMSYLEEDCLVVTVEPDAVLHRAEAIYEQTEQRSLLTAPDELAGLLSARLRVDFMAQEPEDTPAPAPRVKLRIERRDEFGPDLDSMLEELGGICADYERTVVYCIGPAEADRFRALLRDREFPHLDDLELAVGRLSHGALCPAAGLALIPHHRLFHRYRQRRFIRHAHEGRPVESAQDLAPGDLVVHVEHGIGRFLGTSLIERNGRRREHLELEYADGVHVHVPAERIELVHRYIGVGGREPELHRIRSASWRRARRRAEEAVQDLAADLLELQAIRETQPGIAAPGETEWQFQFESEFPYEETDDQLDAIEDVKRDMRSARPMDRLLCGDVGYGKTEVAMRAAFNAVMGGRQVAVLVPTTVLAQQHYRTFRERMADYPIYVEMLSRFRTGAETREILEGMARGTVDIVVGTHKLVQDSVGFKDLGLVIIDEEQRFGVKHKEKLKKLRATVDVLTMTATPIPRTLHMALMGLREISALQTPPRDRQAIKTRVGKFDPELARHAILRELSREGQAYVIHNRVHSIDGFADRLREIAPEATIAVAHGQMPERELSETMELFTDGAIDVLVSTTIIENGLDIPNANTLIVDRAELLGLAEMHQLRGRVGRYIHKAYAYFFLPRDRPVTPEAESRLDAIRRYSQLGAGFDIALRDLEMRGAGNILGPAQSGHIAAVGYNLYCRMLMRAAARLKGEPVEEPPSVTLDVGMEAYLPPDYVPTPRGRMELYRQLSGCTSIEEARDALEAMRDRYGPPPQEATNLVLETEVRILAERAGIGSIHLEDGRLHFGLSDAEQFRRHFAEARRQPRTVGDDLAVLDDGFPKDDPQMLVVFLRRFLAPAQE
ncbi:MAG: transcription-repair coupling factor [Candidatus Brocadiia bacterium]